MAALGNANGNNGGSYMISDIVVPSGSNGVSPAGGAYMTFTARPAAQLTSTHPGTLPPRQGGLVVARTTGGVRG